MTSNRHAVVVGVSDYEVLPKLPSCRFDALSVYEALLNAGFRGENMILLADLQDEDDLTERPDFIAHPSRTFMEDALDALDKRVGENDSVVLYFSGHGINAGTDYLCPKEARADKLNSTAFSLEGVLDRLDRLGTPYVNVVLDACRDELDQQQKAGAAQLKGLGDQTLHASIEKRKNISVLFSCRPKEKSYVIPTPEPQRGAFTIALVEAIRDPNIVTLSALAEYSVRNVGFKNDAYQLGRMQRPILVNPKTKAAAIALYGDPEVLADAVLAVAAQLEGLIPPLPRDLFDMIKAFVQSYWQIERGYRFYQKEMVQELCKKSIEEVNKDYFDNFARQWNEYEQMIPVPSRSQARSSEASAGADARKDNSDRASDRV